MTQLLFSMDEAAKAMSIGKTKLYYEIRDGKIPAKKIGKRVLVPIESINSYIADLEQPSFVNKEGA